MNPRRLLMIGVVPMLLVGGGTALAASNAPGSGAHPAPRLRLAVGTMPVMQLVHPANSPMAISTPTSVATPTPTSISTPSPAPVASATPPPTVAPTYKPAPTPPPVVIVPAPTPVPTPAGPVDSGPLPPITVDFSNGQNWTGTRYSENLSCPGQTDCLTPAPFQILPWGNYSLVVTWKETLVNWQSGFQFTTNLSGSRSGWGPNTGGTGGATSPGEMNSITLTISVAWGPPS